MIPSVPAAFDYTWFLGLDLAKRADRSAIAVLELKQVECGFDFAHYRKVLHPVLHTLYARRLPRGFPYLEIPALVRQLIEQISGPFPYGRQNREVKTLAVDARGPGEPVIELLEREFHSAAARPWNVKVLPVLMSAGDRANTLPDGAQSVPRRAMLANLRLLFEAGNLRIPSALPERDYLFEELAHVQAEGGQAEHDDLAIALALAAWPAVRHHPRLCEPRRGPAAYPQRSR